MWVDWWLTLSGKSLRLISSERGGGRLLEFDPRTSLDPFPLVGRVNCEKKPWILDPTC